MSVDRTIAQPVLEVLSGAIVDRSTVRLPKQVDRKLYLNVDSVLQALGGKWNRRAAAHIFDGDPSDLLDDVILTGTYQKPNQLDFFETQPALGKHVMDYAQLRAGMTVLEPSAGCGALALAAAAVVGTQNVVTVELDQKRYQVLVTHGFTRSHCADFLTWNPPFLFDRVVMNPPFSRQAEIDHVLRAWDFVTPGGRLAAIMSAGVTFRQNRKTEQLRELLARYGKTHDNPPGSFKGSGTTINTITVVMNKP